MKPLTTFEAFCLKNAAHFVAARGRTPRDRTRQQFATLPEAQAYGAAIGDGRTMIYAVMNAATVEQADSRLTLVLGYGNTELAGELIRAVAEEPKAATAPAIGKRQAIRDQAQTGALPQAPDFSKPTHARFRAKLAQILALAEAGDITGLQGFEINPVSSSPKAMARYRDLCVIAITARPRVTA